MVVLKLHTETQLSIRGQEGIAHWSGSNCGITLIVWTLGMIFVYILKYNYIRTYTYNYVFRKPNSITTASTSKNQVQYFLVALRVCRSNEMYLRSDYALRVAVPISVLPTLHDQIHAHEQKTTKNLIRKKCRISTETTPTSTEGGTKATLGSKSVRLPAPTLRGSGCPHPHNWQ